MAGHKALQNVSGGPDILSDYLTEKMRAAQPELENLWHQLADLQEIPVGDLVDSLSTQPIVHGKERNYTPDPVVGLTEGKLIAIRTRGVGSETVEMVDVLRDARYMTEYPANPIMITNNSHSKYTPQGVQLEK